MADHRYEKSGESYWLVAVLLSGIEESASMKRGIRSGGKQGVEEAVGGNVSGG